ncbi:MAG: hypothetical protein KAI06_00220, partial [Anaerolineales bacterium]|nr:hypothetical protein [Anaerolineales bacterium]
PKMIRVLFLCTHNSARSQMAEGLLRWLHDTDFLVFSAGTVATSVRSEAIEVMRELKIDISKSNIQDPRSFCRTALRLHHHCLRQCE